MGLSEYLENEVDEEERKDIVGQAHYDIKILVDKIVEIENALKEKNELDKQLKDFKEQLKQAMKIYEVKKWETPNGIKIALIDDVPDSEEEVSYIDEEEFIKENSKLHNEYVTIRQKYTKTRIELMKGKKGYVRITIPKEEE